MRRDGISRENAEEWINKQMPQEQIEERSQYVIYNDGTSSLEAQVDSILNILKENYTLR
jgi:dephospho-CoA kinase